jgi:hypothetical protein
VVIRPTRLQVVGGLKCERTPRQFTGVQYHFDYFTNIVYNHTTAMPAYRAEIGNNTTNLDMYNYFAPDNGPIAASLLLGA